MDSIQQDYELLKSVYGRFDNAAALHSLVQTFLDGHARNLKLTQSLWQLDGFFAHPQKAMRIEKPDLLRLAIRHSFDARAAFSSKIERGGDPELTSILARLDPELDGLPEYPIRPRHEKEILRANDHQAEKTRQMTEAFENARRYLYRQIAKALFSNTSSQDYEGRNACQWLAENFVDGKNIAAKVRDAIETAQTIGYHATVGAGVKEGIRIAQASEQLREKRRLETGCIPINQ